jgi:hypothetical protein
MAGSTETAQFHDGRKEGLADHPMNDFYDDGLVHQHGWATSS